MDKLIITPRTKIHELLEAYPALESTLIQLAPVFSKLRNPVLRRTIARVTTLQQAALVGNLQVHHLVNTLRKEVGQDNLEGLEASSGKQQQPSWFQEDRVVRRLDARPILAEGGHPLGEVLTGVKDLNKGEIYELITPFIPAPLIERVMAQGFDHWSKMESEDCIFNYFLKK